MKVKRFFAPDTRQAIRMVKMEQGPDAVILSNRKVDGGVEIISAIDYDESLLQRGEHAAPKVASYGAPELTGDDAVEETVPGAPEKIVAAPPTPVPPPPPPAAVPPPHQPAAELQEPALIEMRRELKSLRALLENQLSGLAWGDLSKRNPMHLELLQRLMNLGLSATVCHQVTGRIRPAQDMGQMWRQALDLLAHHIRVTDDDILVKGGIVALIGPTGVGKTTTIAKLAAQYALRHAPRNVGLISADSFRIGAHDQLRRLGRILDIPVKSAADRGELMSALDDFCDRDLVLIDTVGLGQRDERISDQIDMLRSDSPLIKPYLVLSCTARLSCMQEVVRAYQAGGVGGCILTKLDEATSIGAALSVLIQNQMPAAYITDGQKIPDDLYPARALDLVTRGVEIMDQHIPLLEDESLLLTLGRAITDVHVGYKN